MNEHDIATFISNCREQNSVSSDCSETISADVLQIVRSRNSS
jgi:hypothetical protein